MKLFWDRLSGCICEKCINFDWPVGRCQKNITLPNKYSECEFFSRGTSSTENNNVDENDNNS